jgi:hypothetical protein
MTIYTAYFRTGAEFASHPFEAETPQEALALAWEHDISDLWFEQYDRLPVNKIAICDAERNELAVWLDQDLRLRLAAGDLLAALEMAVVALNTQPRFSVPILDTDSYGIVAICDRAVAKAKGGAA